MAEIVVIQPNLLGGSIECIPSKSISHRLVIGALLAGNSQVNRLAWSKDIEATLQAMSSLGYSEYTKGADYLMTLESARKTREEPRIVDCNESGSTLRFLIPLAMDGIQTIFRGKGRLMQRSMTVYEDICPSHGILFKQANDEIIVEGNLSHGLFLMRGDISSQFISGFLFVLPLLRGDSVLQITTTIESKAYIDLTIDAMKQFGVRVMWQGDQTIHVFGRQTYQSSNVSVEGDFSHAGFLLVAGVLGKGTTVTNLRRDSLQGDRALIDVLQKMGANIQKIDDGYCIEPSELYGCEIDVSQIPDLMPILSVVACFAQGKTKFVNGARLRDKECDRLSAMATELARLGVDVVEDENSLVVQGKTNRKLRGGITCEGYNDHRIVMSLAIVASRCENAISITDAMSVTKSAPNFWNEYQALGGKIEIKG